MPLTQSVRWSGPVGGTDAVGVRSQDGRHESGPSPAPQEVCVGPRSGRGARSAFGRCRARDRLLPPAPDRRPSPADAGREALNAWPTKVRLLRAPLRAVAEAPPKRFAGGGYWEAMHGEMTGWFEVRVDGPGRRHYRLFCRLDYEAEGRHNPLLVVIDGRDKPFRTALTDSDYAQVRTLGDEYFSRNPRSVV